MTHNRILALGAAAAVLVAGAAGAAFAHPHAEGDGKTVKRFVIVHDGKDGKHRSGHGAHGVRRFEIHGAGMVDCDGGEKIVDESAGDGDKKTKVVICAKGKPTAASAERLEEALARINSSDELSAEQKARITTALKSAIDRARSAR